MLLFKAKDLKPVLREAIAHQCDVLLVKDQGIYIMSDMGTMQNGRHLVAYACGYHPEKDEGGYERAREEVGGDDFAEKLGFAVSTLNRLLNDQCDLEGDADSHTNYHTILPLIAGMPAVVFTLTGVISRQGITPVFISERY